MTTLLALIGALALAAIPLSLGWRRTAGEAQMAQALGLQPKPQGFDPDKFALQTGTGLSFHQLLLGFLAWTAGGFVAGLPLGPVTAGLFGIAGGLLYAGSLTTRRQELRLKQAKDILRALGVMETLLTQGRPLNQAVEEAAQAVGPDGQRVLGDLVVRMRTAPADQAAEAVRAWTLSWDNPAVDVVGTALLAALEARIEIAPLIGALRQTLSSIVEVLSRARSEAKGIEWQVRFLALYPPAVMVVLALVVPSMGALYAANPLYLLPVLLGSGLSYLLSTRMLRTLSIEASMGLQAGAHAEIALDRMGRVL